MWVIVPILVCMNASRDRRDTIANIFPREVTVIVRRDFQLV